MPANPALIEFHPRLTVWLSLASAAGVLLFVLFHLFGLIHYSNEHLLIKGVLIALFMATAWAAERWAAFAQRLFVAALMVTSLAIGLIVVLEPHEHMALIFLGFTIFGTFLMGSLYSGLAQFAVSLGIMLALYLQHPSLFDKRFYVYLTLFFSLCALLSLAVFSQLRDLFNRIREYERTLTDLAHTDELTGLLNLRGFMRQSQTLFEQHQQRGRPLTLALIDLDYFKQLNDSLGHGAGNVGLRHIAALMRDSLPPEALLGRFGGDEMIALIPDCDSRRAHAAIKRLYEQLAHRPATFEGERLKLSLSIGVATLDPLRDESLNDLLERADEALYRAKARGRGQACFADEETGTPLRAAALASA